MIEKIKVRQLRMEHLDHIVIYRQTGLDSCQFTLSQIMFKADSTHSEPAITLRSSNLTTYKARAWESIDVLGMPDPPRVVVQRGKNGKIKALHCSECGGTEIAEVDRSTRENSLEVDGGQVGVILADGEHHHIGFACLNRECRADLADGDLDESSLVYS